MRVRSDDYEEAPPQTILVTRAHRAQVSFHLLPRPTEKLLVRVTDPAGKPAVGAAVRAGRWIDTCTTDTVGTAVLEWRGNPPEFLAVRQDGAAVFYLKKPLEQATGGVLDVRLEPESVIEVDVRGEGGRELPPGYVYIDSLDGISLDDAGAPYKHDLERAGGVRFDGLPAGRYRFALEGRGGDDYWGALETEVARGATRRVAFTVPAPFVVTGTAYHNGQPLRSGTLFVLSGGKRGSPTLSLDGTGRYHLSLRHLGRYTFELRVQDRFGQEVEREITGTGVVDLEYLTVSLAFQVIGRDGRPLANVDGQLEGPQVHSFHTDADGRFKLPYVRPGTYRWHAHRPTQVEGKSEWFGGEKIEVAADGEVILRVRGAPE